jgi:hypothetical protein
MAEISIAVFTASIFADGQKASEINDFLTGG